MALASHLPESRNTVAWLSRLDGFFRVPALLLIFLIFLALAPATVWGDIYKWTDEQGNTVISNIQPVNPRKVSGVELLAASTKPATQMPGAPLQQGATRTEQALEARIENLERQIQAQQYAEPPQTVPQSDYSEGYYPTPGQPTLDPGYNSGYDPGYYPGYFPGYYYPWPPSYSFVAVGARTFARRPVPVRRPGFASRPVFVGRPPVFVGRPPVFVSRSPVFVGQSALGVSRGTSVGGGSMHRGRR